MAYEKTNWQTGDIVTAEKLNKLENGVASGGGAGGFMLVSRTDSGINKSYNELLAAINNSIMPVLVINWEDDGESGMELYELQSLGSSPIGPDENIYQASFSTLNFGSYDADEPMNG